MYTTSVCKHHCIHFIKLHLSLIRHDHISRCYSICSVVGHNDYTYTAACNCPELHYGCLIYELYMYLKGVLAVVWPHSLATSSVHPKLRGQLENILSDQYMYPVSHPNHM